MVPGMTERERLAADVRLCAWLADARLGPASITHSPSRPKRAVSPLGIWRGVLTAALLLGQRIRLLPGASKPLPKRAGPDPMSERLLVVTPATEVSMDAQLFTTRIGLAADAATRRTSLLALGGAALAAVAVHAPLTQAKNKAGKKARKRCKQQVARCREQLSDFCQGDAGCEADLLPCCTPLADCRADEAVDCAFAYLEQ